MRRATVRVQSDGDLVAISIHALHEESDSTVRAGSTTPVISIHALHEESDPELALLERMYEYISIHALHEESDSRILVKRFLIHDFNPRSP